MATYSRLAQRSEQTLAARCVLVAAAAWWSQAQATQIHFRSLEEVVQRAGAAVIVDVQDLRVGPTNGPVREVSMSAKVVRVVFGGKPRAPSLHCTYWEGRPHRRGSMAVSPLISGSGLEFDVKVGERVILLTQQDMPHHSATCSILRVEPLASERVIVRTLTRRQ